MASKLNNMEKYQERECDGMWSVACKQRDIAEQCRTLQNIAEQVCHGLPMFAQMLVPVQLEGPPTAKLSILQVHRIHAALAASQENAELQQIRPHFTRSCPQQQGMHTKSYEHVMTQQGTTWCNSRGVAGKAELYKMATPSILHGDPGIPLKFP